jgi:hypothetical protein
MTPNATEIALKFERCQQTNTASENNALAAEPNESEAPFSGLSSNYSQRKDSND